jgi:lactoylglutathione lyase
MQIEHVAMYVEDLEKTKDFFIKYFGANAGERYYNPKTELQSYFLGFDDGARLEIMQKPRVSNVRKELARTGYIHIAFSVGSREKVDELTRRLQEDGYKVVSGPRVTGDGYYESCVLCIEDNQIEITV